MTRNAIHWCSFAAHVRDKIRQIDGVSTVSRPTGSVGSTSTNGISLHSSFDGAQYVFRLYPEFHIASEQQKTFVLDRKGCIVGRKLAQTYGWKIGDTMPLRGTIFPGDWAFVVRGIYTGAEPKTDESQFFFHWDYLNETLKKTAPKRANQVGIFLVGIGDADAAAEISRRIDDTFRNSLAETLTETEKAFAIELHLDDRSDRRRDPHRLVRRHRHHHGRDGKYDGDVRARAAVGVCDVEGAGVWAGIPARADLWRIPAAGLAWRHIGHRRDLSGRFRFWRSDGQVVSRVSDFASYHLAADGRSLWSASSPQSYRARALPAFGSPKACAP